MGLGNVLEEYWVSSYICMYFFHFNRKTKRMFFEILRIIKELKNELDLESIGSSLGLEGELIWSWLDRRGPDIRSGFVNRHLIIEGHRGFKRS